MTPPDPPLPSAEPPHPSQVPEPSGAEPDDGAEGDAIELGAGFDFTDPNSPLAPYYLRASHLVAIALLGLIFFFFSNVVPLGHTDVWGHLNYGRWIVEHGALPATEPFSPFSDRQTEYYHFMWLAQSGAYLVYQAGAWLAGGDAVRQAEGGVHALRAVSAVIILLRFLVLMIAFRRLTGSLPLACAGVVLVFVIHLGPASAQRPQTVGELCFALVLLALVRPTLSLRALILVPAIFVLWANCHGSFLAGLMLVGVVAAGRGLDVCRAAGTWNLFRSFGDAQVRRLLLLLTVSVAAIAVLNPHGPALYRHALGLAANPNIQTMEEWLPLPFSLGSGGHWTYWTLLVILLLSQAVSPRGLTPGQLLLVAVFGVLPLVQQRMMTWWVMVAPLVILPLWQATGAALPWPWLHHQTVLSFRKTLLAVLLVVLALMYSGPGSWLLAGRPRPLDKAVAPETPVRLAAQLKATPGGDPRKAPWPELAAAFNEHFPRGRFTGTVFASERLGDYLIWALPPEVPVLVYAHVHVFPPSHWEDYARVLFAKPGWWEVLDRHRVNLLVFEPEVRTALAKEVREDAATWRVIDDGSAPRRAGEPGLMVAVRRKPL